MPLRLDGVHGLSVDAGDLHAYLDAMLAEPLVSLPRPPAAPSPHAKKGKPGTSSSPGPQPGPGWVLDVDAFVTAVDGALADQTAGYVLQLNQNSEPVAHKARNAAINGAAEGDVFSNVPWTPEVSMDIASCSKTLTAMALTKLILNTPDITFKTSIFDYLPTYWNAPDTVKQITFADLMRQRSGLLEWLLDPVGAVQSVGDPKTYSDAKMAVILGPDTSAIGGPFHYRNVNFTLCRVLIATINKNIDVDANFDYMRGNPTDLLWDYLTMRAYAEYMWANIFEPAGVVDALLTRPLVCALAYSFPVDGPGWNSGDLSAYAGEGGWHMSVSELLKVMGTFRRAGTIMTVKQAQQMLDNQFGIDPTYLPTNKAGVDTTNAGTVYGKNGEENQLDQAKQLQVEQSVAYYLPDEMELVVFVNSPVGTTGTFWLLGQVADLYADNLVYGA